MIATRITAESLAIAKDAVQRKGALTLSVYSPSDDVIEQAIESPRTPASRCRST